MSENSGVHPTADSGRHGVGDVWKLIATGLAGVAISGASFFLLYAQRLVTRDEVAGMIQSQAPYMRDKATLKEGVLENRASIRGIEERLRKIEISAVRLSTQIDKISDTQVEIKRLLKEIRDRKE